MEEQAKVLREPQGLAEEALLVLHRCLWPEEHRAYWAARDVSDWPHGWDGESVYQWDAGTIEWAAGGIAAALRDAGVIA